MQGFEQILSFFFLVIIVFSFTGWFTKSLDQEIYEAIKEDKYKRKLEEERIKRELKEIEEAKITYELRQIFNLTESSNDK